MEGVMYAYFIANYSPFKSAPPSPKPAGSSAHPGALRRLIRSAVLGWQRQRTIAALQESDDYVLRDIGLHRDEIPLIVKRMQADTLPKNGSTSLKHQHA
jgi:uncharacterized protein YjiS (DUF1127 family)